MNEKDSKSVNAGALAGIPADGPSEVDELRAKLAAAEKENAEHRARIAEQLKDNHAGPGVANESRATSKERWAIVVEEGRDENEINPVYVAVNGRGYSLKRGEVVNVPREVISVLDNAIELRATPIMGENGVVSGYRTREARRFPYRNYGKSRDANGNELKVVLPEARDL